MNTQIINIIRIVLVSLIFNVGLSQTSFAAQPLPLGGIKYKTVTIDGLDIFYREAGNPKHPTIFSGRRR
jgi:hypothetical protein